MQSPHSSAENPDEDKHGSSSGHIKTKKRYVQKYRSDWENLPEFKKWICPSKKGTSFFLLSCQKWITPQNSNF
jgi:hypothetical protein